MEFVYNDGGRKESGKRGSTRDCVCRSIAIATNSPYAITYKLMNLMAKKDGGFGSARTGMYENTYAPFLIKFGWQYTRCNNWNNIPKSGTFLVHCTRHLTVVIDGVINDTWNPSTDKRQPQVHGYYYLPE